MNSPIRWVSVFLDTPPAVLDATLAFWTAVTRSAVGTPVGDSGEFLPLEPQDGHPCLWLQRIDDGPVACHLDLYVDDVRPAAGDAEALGATVILTRDGLVVLTSPGGLPFCLVDHRDQVTRPGPVGEPDARSHVDQLCLDIPPGRYEDEVAFWQQLTGWQRIQSGEFERLVRPDGLPFALLMQRLGDEQPAVAAHLDLSCDDRDAETARHGALGAEVVQVMDGWTVMRDPGGRTYCITSRKPWAV